MNLRAYIGRVMFFGGAIAWIISYVGMPVSIWVHRAETGGAGLWYIWCSIAGVLVSVIGMALNAVALPDQSPPIEEKHKSSAQKSKEEDSRKKHMTERPHFASYGSMQDQDHAQAQYIHKKKCKCKKCSGH